ncbi:MAG: hypothetical protein PHO70_02375 [Candidatus Omnitrophica bacterium]|nr:hypothetical protein [Candidatus Omnitrophota bacterium]
MRVKFLYLFLALFLSGCLTSSGSVNNKTKDNKVFVVKKADLNGDMLIEIVTAEDQKDQVSKGRVAVMRKDKGEIGSFSVPGHFSNLELIELDMDGCKQIAVRSKDDSNRTYFTIHKLKNMNLVKIFEISSDSGIETEFDSTIPRIRVARNITKVDGSCQIKEIKWATWVWTGDRFIKE